MNALKANIVSRFGSAICARLLTLVSVFRRATQLLWKIQVIVWWFIELIFQPEQSALTWQVGCRGGEWFPEASVGHIAAEAQCALNDNMFITELEAANWFSTFCFINFEYLNGHTLTVWEGLAGWPDGRMAGWPDDCSLSLIALEDWTRMCSKYSALLSVPVKQLGDGVS
jgi:hypothetical protein